MLFTPTSNASYKTGALTLTAPGVQPLSMAIESVPATLNIDVFDDPDDSAKTDTYVKIAGNSAAALAEIDTGSQITVVTQAMVGPNIQMTSQTITLDYGQGENILVGTLGYGTVSFTTSDHKTLTTSPNTPIVVVPAIPQGDYDVILGMDLHTQVAARLYLPYPYNQMFVLNKTGGYLTVGTLTQSEINQFGTYQLQMTPCDNMAVSNTV